MSQRVRSVEQSPSGTAKGNAAIRAIAAREFTDETLGGDYLAENFLTPLLKFIVKSPRARTWLKKKRLAGGAYEYIVARTAYFDQLFKQALQENYPQILLLGAGYDTRAYRFKDLIKDTHIIELDAPMTQQQKKSCLLRAGISIPDQVSLVPINFNTDSLQVVLTKAGFDETQKTFFVWEGVIYYLAPQAVDTTLEFIRMNSPPGSILVFDYAVPISPDKYDMYYGVKELAKLMQALHPGEPGRFAVEEDEIATFLADRGFDIIKHHTEKYLEGQFLTTHDGSLLGRVTGCFRIVQAVVKA